MSRKTKKEGDKPTIEYFHVSRSSRGQQINMAPILEYITSELLDKSNETGDAWVKAVEFNTIFGLNVGKVKRHRKGKDPIEFESLNNKCVDLLRKENIGIRITRKDDETWVSFRKKIVRKKQ